MAPILLKEFVFPMSCEKFLSSYWMNASWYERFLSEKLHDNNVTIEEWKEINSDCKCRTIHSMHPSKYSYPGLPSFTEASKTQVLEIHHHHNHQNHNLEINAAPADDDADVIITETTKLKGIPFADYFQVVTYWKVYPIHDTESKADNHSLVDANKCQCHCACKVCMFLELQFTKSTWLQQVIESNTTTEIRQVFEMWIDSVMQIFNNPSATTESATEQKDMYTMSWDEASKVFKSLAISGHFKSSNKDKDADVSHDGNMNGIGNMAMKHAPALKRINDTIDEQTKYKHDHNVRESWETNKQTLYQYYDRKFDISKKTDHVRDNYRHYGMAIAGTTMLSFALKKFVKI